MQIDELRRENQALRAELAQVRERLRFALEVHQNRLDEWGAEKAEYITQLAFGPKVWIVQESHYDYHQVIYVASSAEHADEIIKARKKSNALIPNWPYKYRPEVWAEELTVDGDEVKKAPEP